MHLDAELILLPLWHAAKVVGRQQVHVGQACFLQLLQMPHPLQQVPTSGAPQDPSACSGKLQQAGPAVCKPSRHAPQGNFELRFQLLNLEHRSRTEWWSLTTASGSVKAR